MCVFCAENNFVSNPPASWSKQTDRRLWLLPCPDDWLIGSSHVPYNCRALCANTDLKPSSQGLHLLYTSVVWICSCSQLDSGVFCYSVRPSAVWDNRWGQSSVFPTPGSRQMIAQSPSDLPPCSSVRASATPRLSPVATVRWWSIWRYKLHAV